MEHPELANLGFDDVDVYCVAEGGETLGQGRRPMRARLDDVRAYRPYVVFLHVGENDLGHMPPGNITWELMQLVNELIPLCRTLIVGQLLSFPSNRRRHHHDVSVINEYLRQDVPYPHVFWRHQCGLWRRVGNFYDGVHLNNYGMYQYWRSLRTIVGRELRRYRPRRPIRW